MDPLTHTLLGANLASTRLGEKTRFAAAALVVGANLPDVDSILYFTGHEDLALSFRRGWTHGVLALVVLPVLQTALLLALDRLRPDPERPANPRWLLVLSALAILTHPFLDWLNNYGMRWLMPFDGTWFYGDSVFIMDPWLWLILGCGWLAPRRATKLTMAILLVAAVLIVRVVANRAPEYLVVVGVVVVILIAALLWRPATRRLPATALALSVAYITMRLIVHEVTEVRVARELGGVERLMVGPHPIDPTRWDFVAEIGEVYRFGRFSWREGLSLGEPPLPVARPSREWDLARQDPSLQGFLTWARFPWYEVEGDRVHVHDARYAVRRRPGGGFGGRVVTIPARSASQ
jgi:inner membrane protein